MKKVFLSAFVIFAFACLLAGLPTAAFADGGYSVETPHVIINQILGGKDEVGISHSFIELYNPTDSEVDLSSYAIHYKSSAADTDYGDKWYKFNLSGVIPSKCSYLIRCQEHSDSADATYKVVSFDLDISGGGGV